MADHRPDSSVTKEVRRILDFGWTLHLFHLSISGLRAKSLCLVTSELPLLLPLNGDDNLQHSTSVQLYSTNERNVAALVLTLPNCPPRFMSWKPSSAFSSESSTVSTTGLILCFSTNLTASKNSAREPIVEPYVDEHKQPKRELSEGTCSMCSIL